MNVKVGEINLHVKESGVQSSAPSLIFLHYFGGSALSWREVIDRLVGDFHCLAPDLRGFGKSQDTASFAIEDYARDIIGLISALKLKNYILIGHSMGGKIALEVAAQKPANLRSLILFAPSPPSPEPMKPADRKKMLTTHGAEKAAVETIENGATRTLSDAVLADAVAANLQSGAAAWRAWLETESRRDITARMPEIEVPIFAAVGANDENMTADLIDREIISRVATSALSVIENAKHLLPLEAPEETADFIRRAVEKTSASEN